jgi:hypothetical protein
MQKNHLNINIYTHEIEQSAKDEIISREMNAGEILPLAWFCPSQTPARALLFWRTSILHWESPIHSMKNKTFDTGIWFLSLKGRPQIRPEKRDSCEMVPWFWPKRNFIIDCNSWEVSNALPYNRDFRDGDPHHGIESGIKTSFYFHFMRFMRFIPVKTCPEGYSRNGFSACEKNRQRFENVKLKPTETEKEDPMLKLPQWNPECKKFLWKVMGRFSKSTFWKRTKFFDEPRVKSRMNFLHPIKWPIRAEAEPSDALNWETIDSSCSQSWIQRYWSVSSQMGIFTIIGWTVVSTFERPWKKLFIKSSVGSIGLLRVSLLMP